MASGGGNVMAAVGEEGRRCGGGGENQAAVVMKKGPWTPAEDATLIEYVRKHGEGNWNAVMRNSGLQRCGKSCRLRWANHLRPNLKKGAFTPEEERAIIHLHAKYGNKWARMAAQLPGRTDNEIKNYWNTRTKRRQRAGLPIYPHEIQRELAELHFQQQLQRHHQRQQQTLKLEQQQQQHQQQQQQHALSSSSSSSIPSFFSSSSNQPRNNSSNYNPAPLSLFNPIRLPVPTPPLNPIQTHPNPPFLSFPNGQFNFFPNTHNANKGGFALPLSPVSVSVSPSSSNSPISPYPSLLPPSFFPQSLRSPQLNQNHVEFNSPTFLRAQFDDPPTSFTQLLEGDFPPPPQTPLNSTTTPTSSATSGGDYGLAPPPKFNDYAIAPTPPNNDCGGNYTLDQIFPQGSSGGLLEDVLRNCGSSCNKEDNSKGKQTDSYYHEGQDMVDELMVDHATEDFLELIYGENSCDDQTWPVNQLDDSSSSIGMKLIQEPVEERNSFEDDDELSSILETFNDKSNGRSSNMAGDALEVSPLPSPPPSSPLPSPPLPPPATAGGGSAAIAAMEDHELSLGFCCWNDMPTIIT